MSSVHKCPICNSTEVRVFLERDHVPVLQNLVVNSGSAARVMPHGKLQMAICESCGFVFNRAFELGKFQYDESYDNSQTYSAIFEEHVCSLIQQLLNEWQGHEVRIVEVGCGKGLFLKRLIEATPDAIGYGFDSTYAGPLVDLDGRLRFYRRYYETADGDIGANVVICRHVIEHIPDPLELLTTIRQTLTAVPGAKVYFETPCVRWILTNQAIWDLFYEHCSYFSAQSLTTTFRVAGFEVESVRHVFGGQYLWLEATVARDRTEGVETSADNLATLVQEFANNEIKIRSLIASHLQTAVNKGEVALWGAGAKGVTLANLVDPQGELIRCIVDLNPRKQGHYLPGTGHPIVDYRRLPNLGITTVINMNSNYYAENLNLLNAAQIDVNLVDLADWIGEL
jgi:SAM-dependent methyltransferase